MITVQNEKLGEWNPETLKPFGELARPLETFGPSLRRCGLIIREEKRERTASTKQWSCEMLHQI